MAARSASRILTTVVGSYPVPDWLPIARSEQALRDATAVVLKTQELAGIDLIADGELYRFDVNHPDTNGMIDYFVRPLGGIRTAIGAADRAEFAALFGMGFRAQPAGVVEGPITEGTLDLPGAFARAQALTRTPLKFTVTSPHMLARTLVDHHYRDPGALGMALAEVLAAQVAKIPAKVVQLDEANLPGHPEEAPWAVPALNRVLASVTGAAAVHICFGNYGGQTIQQGTWRRLVKVINSLQVDHVVLELAHRSPSELASLKGIRPEIGLGLGVIDIKQTEVESADLVARRIEKAAAVLGRERIRYVHPDCGFWMLKRSIADRKLAVLVAGRDRFLGR